MATDYGPVICSLMLQTEEICSATASDQVHRLVTMVHHCQSIEVGTTLAEAQQTFQSVTHDFLAVTQQGRVVGLCSRAGVSFRLSSRYGFALNGGMPVAKALLPRPLIYNPHLVSLPQVLDDALSRTGAEFFEDVVLIDSDGRLLGLVPVPGLAKLQLQLFDRQLHRVVEQDDELRRQNLELFQINQQLRQSQGRYRALFENNALGVALLDPDGVVVAHNRRFEEILELADRPAGTKLSLHECLTEDSRPVFRQVCVALEQTAAHPTPSVVQLRFAFPHGPRTFQLHCGWVTETGQICVFLEDVTDQQEVERQLARQEKQAMLDTLVAGVAHELNNKLTPVLGFAELLEVVAPPSLQNHTRCIRQCSQEAAQIIRQLLNMARPTEADFAPVELGQLCRETLLMLRYQIREHQAEVELHAPSGEAWIRGDAAQLKQVLLNLCLNALHALAGRPEPRLELRIATRDDRVMIHVRDSGTGIQPEHLSRIFDPFFTTKGTRGTGLGLSISASIVRQHGGEIQVESVVGAGSTFTVSLPRGGPGALHPPRVAGSGAGRFADAAHRRVLIVDDEEFVRQFLQEVVRASFGCSVTVAVDGQEAIDKLQVESFDLILSDVRMPRVDGFQLRRWIAENKPELACRTIFVTGHAGSMEVDFGLSHLPGTVVIRKPFTVDAIVAACRPYLVTSS